MGRRGGSRSGSWKKGRGGRGGQGGGRGAEAVRANRGSPCVFISCGPDLESRAAREARQVISELANELFPLPAKVWEVAGLQAPEAEEDAAAGSSTHAGLDAEIAALKSKPVSTSSRFVDAHLNVKTSVLLVPHPGLEAAALALASSPDGPAVPLYNPYRCALTTADEPPVFESAQCSALDAAPGACTVDVCLLVRTLLERIAAGDMVLRVCQRILPMPITTYPDVPRCAAAVARLAPGWMKAVASQRAALATAPEPFSFGIRFKSRSVAKESRAQLAANAAAKAEQAAAKAAIAKQSEDVAAAAAGPAVAATATDEPTADSEHSKPDEQPATEAAPTAALDEAAGASADDTGAGADAREPGAAPTALGLSEAELAVPSELLAMPGMPAAEELWTTDFRHDALVPVLQKLVHSVGTAEGVPNEHSWKPRDAHLVVEAMSNFAGMAVISATAWNTFAKCNARMVIRPAVTLPQKRRREPEAAGAE